MQSTFVSNMLDQMLFPTSDSGADGKRPMLPFNKKSMPEPRPAYQIDAAAGEKAAWEADGSQQLHAHDDATRRETWRKLYPKASDDAINLLMGLMTYDPTKRSTAKNGLEHAYCAQFHDPDSEVTYAVKVRGKDGAEAEETLVKIDVHDNKKLSVKKYQEHIYTMCTRGDRKADGR